tara:strand:- start:2472 stop:2723 length:252 start_codon:yes stop_codon:yes gene_type:complete
METSRWRESELQLGAEKNVVKQSCCYDPHIDDAWLAPLNSVGYIFAICPNLLDNFKQGQNRYHKQFFQQVNYELKSRKWVSEE